MKPKFMMKQRNNNIEAQVAETMKLIDEIKPLKVNHLFRVRLMQRVEREFEQKSEHARPMFGNRIDLRLAFMVLLIIVNLGGTLLTVQQNSHIATSGISEMLDKLSDDYTSQEFAYYDQTSPAQTETVTNDSQTP